MTPHERTFGIDSLASLCGVTTRTVRSYQDRGLLPAPERRGRANAYGAVHVARLRQITDLLARGYGLSAIKELLAACSAGRGLEAILEPVLDVRYEPVHRPPTGVAPPVVGLPDDLIGAVVSLVGEDRVTAFVIDATEQALRVARLEPPSSTGP